EELLAMLPSPGRLASAVPVAANGASVTLRERPQPAMAPIYIGDDDREILMGPVRPVIHPRSVKNGAPPPRVVLAKRPKIDEPIAKAFKEQWSKLSNWWNTGK